MQLSTLINVLRMCNFEAEIEILWKLYRIVHLGILHTWKLALKVHRGTAWWKKELTIASFENISGRRTNLKEPNVLVFIPYLEDSQFRQFRQYLRVRFCNSVETIRLRLFANYFANFSFCPDTDTFIEHVSFLTDFCWLGYSEKTLY